MGFWLQLRLLLWKNFTLRRRQPVRVVIELLWPLVLFLILVWVRTRGLRDFVPECHFEDKAMPSAGVAPWLQGIVCTSNNTCHEYDQASENPGDVLNSQGGLILTLVQEVNDVLGNQSNAAVLAQIARDVETLSQAAVQLQPLLNALNRTLLSFVTNETALREELRANNVTLPPGLLAELLNATLALPSLLGSGGTGLNATTQSALLLNTVSSLLNTTAVSTVQAALCSNATSGLTSLLPAALPGVANVTAAQQNLCSLNTSQLAALFNSSLGALNVSSQTPGGLAALTQQGVALIQLVTALAAPGNASLPTFRAALCNTTALPLVPANGSAAQLQRDLCALNDQQLGGLLTALRDNVNGTALLGQGQNLLQNVTGQQLLTNLQDVTALLQDLQQQMAALPSLQRLLETLTGSGLLGRLNSTLGGAGGAQMFSRLVCGRDNALISGGGGSFTAPTDVVDEEQEEELGELFSNKTYLENGTFCDQLESVISRGTGLRIIYRQLKPILRGKVLYTPDTPETRAIIKEANETFQSLAAIQGLGEQWVAVEDQVYAFLNSSAQLQALRQVLAIPAILSAVPQARNISQFLSNAPKINGSASDWRDLFDSISSAATYSSAVLSCFDLNRFEGHPTEESLIEPSLKYIENNTFWAALVFDVSRSANASNTSGVTNVTVPSFIRYKIRMDVSKVDDTDMIMDQYYRRGPRRSPWSDLKYITNGFAYLQDMVEHGLIKLQSQGLAEATGIYLQQMPYPCYIYDVFTWAISRSLPLFMVLAWIYSVAMIVKGIVVEKEKRLKEVMKIMGLGNGVHWVGWFITSFVMMIISVILLTIVLRYGEILSFSDPTAVLVFLTAFTVSTICQCFLVSVFFSNANVAATCAGIFYFVFYLPYPLCLQWEEIMTASHKAIACLSCTVSFGFGCSYISRFEEMGVGLQWSNMNTSPIIDDNYNMTSCILMLLVDSAVYLVLTWYIEAVFPGQYGVPRPFYFPFTKSYWCGSSEGGAPGEDYRQPDVEMRQQDSRNFEAEPTNVPVGVAVRELRKQYSGTKKPAVDGLTLNFYEGQITSFLGHNGAGKTTTMSILTGLYRPTSGTAVIYGKDIRHDIDSIRQNLGMCPQHNVLFDDLTVGEHIWFYGRLKGASAEQVKKEEREMIRDIKLPHKRHALSKTLSGGMKRKLSVGVAFVGGAKTVILDEPTAGVDPYARRAIWDLLLKYRQGRTILLSTHHMDEADVLGDRIAIISLGKLRCCGSSLFLKSRFGSGYTLTLVKGQAAPTLRPPPSLASSRPATAISVRSLSQVKADIDLDEGIEVESRSDRSSTGSDDINKTGDVRGSVESLKKKAPPSDSEESDDELEALPVSESAVRRVVQEHVTDAELLENTGTELSYRLPDEAAKTGAFVTLFKALDTCKQDLGLSSYGLSDTTLEEVFLKVADESGAMGTDPASSARATENGSLPTPLNRSSFRRKPKLKLPGACRKSSGAVDDDHLLTEQEEASSLASGEVEAGFSGAGEATVTGWRLMVRQVGALIVKRFHHVRRNKKGFVCEVILPAVFVCLAMLFSMIVPPVRVKPALELHPWHYQNYVPEEHGRLTTFYSNDAPTSAFTAALRRQLLTVPGPGNRCLNDTLHSLEGGYVCEDRSKANASSVTWYRAYPAAFYSDPNITAASPPCDCSTGIQICSDQGVCPRVTTGYGGCTAQCAGDQDCSGGQRCCDNGCGTACLPGVKPGGLEPPSTVLASSDVTFDLSGRNISDWLVKTWDSFIKRRYGGYSFGDVDPAGISANSSSLADELRRLAAIVSNGSLSLNSSLSQEQIIDLVDTALETLAVRNAAKVWFNNKGWISSMAYMNSLNNLLLRAQLPPGEQPTNYGFSVTNHPMELTQQQLVDELLDGGALDALISICVIFAMSFIPASFTLFLIQERVSSSKHLQFVSGVHPITYWTANYLWDLVNYGVLAVLCMFIFLAFDEQAYVSETNAPCLFALLMLYGVGIIPMMYPFSWVFSVPSTAFVALSCLNVFIGITSTISVFVMELFNDDELNDISAILKQAFLVLPHYCLGRGLVDMTALHIEKQVRLSIDEGLALDKSPFEFDVVGRNLLSMVCIGVFFFFITLLIEYNCGLGGRCIPTQGRFRDRDEEDVDVAGERRRVHQGRADGETLVLKDLTKVYRTRSGKLAAVDHLCVGVPRGQCFGLLGVNGAGKTTTFKMLTGDEAVTRGDAFLNNHSVKTEAVSVHRDMGYCPQFDALDPLLTGEEHLYFYSRIRGIATKQISEVSEWAIKKLALTLYKDRVSSKYSGGNKRKLSTAIALIGNPPVIFLDEPTTGMDPGARRFLWTCIRSVVREGRSVILTSHSMEECEALCARLAIMVNGQFQCLGSVQHLKNRFGEGYTVQLRGRGQQPDLDPVVSAMTKLFPGCKLADRHHNTLMYQLPERYANCLAEVFTKLQDMQRGFEVEDFSVTQTTLDQVFINFAKKQSDMLDDEQPADDAPGVSGAEGDVELGALPPGQGAKAHDAMGAASPEVAAVGYTTPPEVSYAPLPKKLQEPQEPQEPLFGSRMRANLEKAAGGPPDDVTDTPGDVAGFRFPQRPPSSTSMSLYPGARAPADAPDPLEEGEEGAGLEEGKVLEEAEDAFVLTPGVTPAKPVFDMSTVEC